MKHAVATGIAVVDIVVGLPKLTVAGFVEVQLRQSNVDVKIVHFCQFAHFQLLHKGFHVVAVAAELVRGGSEESVEFADLLVAAVADEVGSVDGLLVVQRDSLEFGNERLVVVDAVVVAAEGVVLDELVVDGWLPAIVVEQDGVVVVVAELAKFVEAVAGPVTVAEAVVEAEPMIVVSTAGQ